MLAENYYQVLQISPQATIKQIKAAFRNKILKYHPDKNTSNHQSSEFVISGQYNQNFKEQSMRIISAYQYLINPQQRQIYDKILFHQQQAQKINNVRFKHTVSVTKSNQNQEEKNEENESIQANKNQHLDDEDEIIFFPCQQCFGENKIDKKQLKNFGQIQNKQITINCQFCGIYMVIEE